MARGRRTQSESDKFSSRNVVSIMKEVHEKIDDFTNALGRLEKTELEKKRLKEELHEVRSDHSQSVMDLVHEHTVAIKTLRNTTSRHQDLMMTIIPQLTKHIDDIISYGRRLNEIEDDIISYGKRLNEIENRLSVASGKHAKKGKR